MGDVSSNSDEPRLRLACSCASASDLMSDPWAAIPHDGKLNDGAKERILNALARQPRTISQLAGLLGISAPAVHRHVTDLLASELIAEVVAPDDGCRSGVERYYQPGFPIVRAADRAALQPVLAELADAMAEAFRAQRPALAAAVAATTLPDRGTAFASLRHYLYATATRLARARLEAAGELPAWPAHADGSRWIWWAEEPLETEAP